MGYSIMRLGMHLGITGTRKGMTGKQRSKFTQLMRGMVVEKFSNGQCVGVDAQAVIIVKSLHPDCHVISRPGSNKSMTSDVYYTEQYDPIDNLERNRQIVDECDLLIVVPETKEEVIRSGTWSTFRYAKKIGRPTLVIWP